MSFDALFAFADTRPGDGVLSVQEIVAVAMPNIAGDRPERIIDERFGADTVISPREFAIGMRAATRWVAQMLDYDDMHPSAPVILDDLQISLAEMKRFAAFAAQDPCGLTQLFELDEDGRAIYTSEGDLTPSAAGAALFARAGALTGVVTRANVQHAAR